MAEKRFDVRFLDSEAAGKLGCVEVDDVALVRGGEPQSMTESQLERAKKVAPKGVLRTEPKPDTDRGNASKEG